jgi:hypothetical protein
LLRIGDLRLKTALIDLPQSQEIAGPVAADCEFHLHILDMSEKGCCKHLKMQALRAALFFLKNLRRKSCSFNTSSRNIRI